MLMFLNLKTLNTDNINNLALININYYIYYMLIQNLKLNFHMQ